jgi:hypothetical protein
MSEQQTDIILELRTLALLIETKASVTFGEQDAAKLLEAADEIARLREALEGLVAYLDGQAYRNYEQESELLMAARAALKGQP